MTLSRPSPQAPHALRDAFRTVRSASRELAAPLSPEDQCVQSMPDASPTKWHLAHTSWFFETVVLQPHADGYRAFDPRFQYLFNSYYEALGPRHPRPQRGLLTRPAHGRSACLSRPRGCGRGALHGHGADDAAWATIAPLLELGLHHEQQHQELLLTDILHAFSCNPLLPAYKPTATRPSLRLATPDTRAHAELARAAGWSCGGRPCRRRLRLRQRDAAPSRCCCALRASPIVS
jgi:hypothetical protein